MPDQNESSASTSNARIADPPCRELTGTLPLEAAGERVDRAIAALFPDYSRSRLQACIQEGQAWLEGRVPRSRDRVRGGERVRVHLVLHDAVDDRPQDLPLTVLYEDEHLAVIDKPAGLVVHPAAGNRSGTLLNALLHRYPEVAAVPRAGLVHRLDKDTTGLLVIARSLPAHHSLTQQLKARTVLREYEAVAQGVLVAGGTVEQPIGRHPVHRKRMAVIASGRPAVTHYRVAEKFCLHTRLRVRLETGRTHQIRVHLAHLRHPLVGDPVYGGRLRLPPRAAAGLEAALRHFPRQALHAARLELRHPASGETLAWEAPLPPDLAALLAALREDAAAAEPGA